MLQLSSLSALFGALRCGRTVEAQAYTLSRKVLQALEAAARRGASVAVRLEADPVSDRKGALAKYNRRLVGEMRAAGVDAALESHVHAKSIDVDGTRYLDEKNFAGDSDLVLADDDPADPAVATRKSDALAAETALLRSARAPDDVIVESETFGATSVSRALRELAAAGVAARLIIAGRSLKENANERKELASLAAAGVRIRRCNDSSKLAVAGNAAWAGSANATSAWGRYDMTDWGARTGDVAIVGAVRDRLEKLWAHARPL